MQSRPPRNRSERDREAGTRGNLRRRQWTCATIARAGAQRARAACVRRGQVTPSGRPQTGALWVARAGKIGEEILRRYYGGVELRRLY